MIQIISSGWNEDFVKLFPASLNEEFCSFTGQESILLRLGRCVKKLLSWLILLKNHCSSLLHDNLRVGNHMQLTGERKGTQHLSQEKQGPDKQ